jgi:multicomponent Na+:H+ antiporter subunit D
MTSSWAMAMLILGPLAAAALAFALPKRGRWMAMASVGIAAVALITLIRKVLADGVQVHRVGGWGAPLGIDLRADGLAVLMSGDTTLIAGAMTLYSGR